MGEIVSNQLFVAGYSRSKVQDEKDVREIFRKYGSVKEVAYKGSYSFITFSNEDEAKEALTEMNGATYNGQKLKVDVVDNRKGRRNGPNESDECFKCGKGGHWARDCPKGRSPRRSRRYSNSRSRLLRHSIIDITKEDLAQDHVPLTHPRVPEGETEITEIDADIATVPGEAKNKKGNYNKRRSPSDSQHHSTS